MCSRKFCKFQRKALVLEYLFNKVTGVQLYQKETLRQVFSSENFSDVENTYFEEHLLMTASDIFN